MKNKEEVCRRKQGGVRCAEKEEVRRGEKGRLCGGEKRGLRGKEKGKVVVEEKEDFAVKKKKSRLWTRCGYVCLSSLMACVVMFVCY